MSVILILACAAEALCPCLTLTFTFRWLRRFEYLRLDVRVCLCSGKGWLHKSWSPGWKSNVPFHSSQNALERSDADPWTCTPRGSEPYCDKYWSVTAGQSDSEIRGPEKVQPIPQIPRFLFPQRRSQWPARLDTHYTRQQLSPHVRGKTYILCIMWTNKLSLALIKVATWGNHSRHVCTSC